MVLARAAAAVYLYNGFLFKLWYLSGQVEVYCLMSSMRPQLGRCAVDRGLCPVSDWGLGLVTGPALIGSLPLQPAQARSRPHGRGKRLLAWGFEKRGWTDRSGGLDDSMDCFLLANRRTQA